MNLPARGGRARTVSVNLLGILFMNTVLLWRPMARGVITESWADMLWAANFSLSLNVVGNSLLAFYRPAWLQAWLKTAFAAAGLLFFTVFLVVFPLDFSGRAGDWLNPFIRVLVGIAAAACLIVTVVGATRKRRGAAPRSGATPIDAIGGQRSRTSDRPVRRS